MIRKILVPTDGSDHANKAIEIASEIALKCKATLHLVHVVSPLPTMGGPDIRKQFEDEQQKFAKEILKKAEKEVKNKGVESFESTTLNGYPAEEIIQFARKSNIDTIIMGSHGAGRLEGLLLGSVSHKVCQMAHCTCMTVK
jgi:nucleotide-binding universal stress UspA family protein